MNQAGKNFVSSIHVPTTDVIRPQPSSNNYLNDSRQTTFNLNTSAYPMPNLKHQYVGTIQQGSINSKEFLQMNGNSLIQQKLIEDQRKLSQNALKKRHFNEQKEKFCAFSTKDKVTADSMIENIFEKSPLQLKSAKYSGTGHVSNFQSYSNSSNSVKHKEQVQQPPTNYSRREESGTRHALPLPDWLADPFQLPAVYKKAGGLVESQDGFVDTSRAYMLLMRTNIQPALLGVMWEMVNRTQPGRLKMSEFYGLLALVALVQNGQAIPSADYLASITQPICPVIDHPVLAVPENKVVKTEQSGVKKEKNIPNVRIDEDLDEFDDFVCAQPVNTLPMGKNNTNSAPVTNSTLSPSSTSAQANEFPSSFPESSLNKNSINRGTQGLIEVPIVSGNISFTNNSVLPAPPTAYSSSSAVPTDIDLILNNELYSISSSHVGLSAVPPKNLDLVHLSKNKLPPPPESSITGCKGKVDKINLPILGASPKRIVSDDDDFADFQSNISGQNENYPRKVELPDVNYPTDPKSSDKYAVLRGIDFKSRQNPRTKSSVVENKEACDFDPDFGDFHSAQESQSFPQANTIPSPTNLPMFEADLLRTYSTDPFGEFEDAAQLDRPLSQLNIEAARSGEEDDFGDFVSSDFPSMTYPQCLTSNLSVAESLIETQSVASLELPGLYETINLSSNASQADVLSQDPIGRLDKEETMAEESSLYPNAKNKSSSLEFEDIFALTHQPAAPTKQNVHPSVTEKSIPISDKYSFIRDHHERREFNDPRSETWTKCLIGCSKLLSEGATRLQGIAVGSDLRDVLSTSQMQEYLSNLNEVWRVCQRILFSTRTVPTCSKIEDLLAENQSLWTSIVSISECQFDKMGDKDRQPGGTGICHVCLVDGGADLIYGGHRYHSACANLWLNTVDVILPAISASSSAVL